VSAGWLLLGLLALSFVGSSVARGRGVEGFGLPSGSEWLLSGIVVGPQVFRLVQPNAFEGFAPLVAAGTGWVSFAIGQRFGVQWRVVRRGGSGLLRADVALGALCALCVGSIVAIAAYWVLGFTGTMTLPLRRGTALFLGLSLASSARQLVDWARERLGATGRVTDLLESIVGGGELLSLLGTAPLAVLISSPESTPSVLLVHALSPVLVGLLFGAVGLGLLRIEAGAARTYAILFGILLLSVGLSMRVGSSAIAAGFVLGWVLGNSQKRGRELSNSTRPTEGAVILPLLVIGGACVDWASLGNLLVVALGAVVVRLPATFGCAGFLRRQGGLSSSTVALGASLCSTGEIAVLLGLQFWLLVPGGLGQVVLASAILASLLGELLGAWGIRATLASAGELALDGGSESRALGGNHSPPRGSA